jgi:hypothetical protein
VRFTALLVQVVTENAKAPIGIGEQNAFKFLDIDPNSAFADIVG